MNVEQAVAISLIELALILSIYHIFIIPAIEKRVISKWLDEINTGGLDLTALLADVTDDAADKVFNIIKNQLLAGSGNLAKVLSNPGGDPDLTALKLGEGLLKDLGLKSPSALMVFKLLKSLNVAPPKDVSGGGSSDFGAFRVGSDLLEP